MAPESIAIVGAGKAAAAAIVALREAGFYGTISLAGNESHMFSDRPPLSKSTLTDAAHVPVPILDADTLARLDVNLHGTHTATRIDRERRLLHLDSGETLAWDKLLLATGARARPLPHAPFALTLRTHADALVLRDRLKPGARLVIIGAGFIGLELAASAAALGVQVTVLETQERILMRGASAPIAACLQARHARAGIMIACGVSIKTVEPTGVTLIDGRIFPADLVVAAIGALPNTDLAEAAGLALDNGIACDATLTTSDPDIVAAGDCCSLPHPLFDDARLRFESWGVAQDMGAHAAHTLLGNATSFQAVPWFWSDQHDMTLHSVGLTHASPVVVHRDGRDGGFIEFSLDVSGRLVAAAGVGPGNSIARDIKLAGRLVARRAVIAPSSLNDASVRLKSHVL